MPMDARSERVIKDDLVFAWDVDPGGAGAAANAVRFEFGKDKGGASPPHEIDVLTAYHEDRGVDGDHRRLVPTAAPGQLHATCGSLVRAPRGGGRRPFVAPPRFVKGRYEYSVLIDAFDKSDDHYYVVARVTASDRTTGRNALKQRIFFIAGEDPDVVRRNLERGKLPIARKGRDRK